VRRELNPETGVIANGVVGGRVPEVDIVLTLTAGRRIGLNQERTCGILPGATTIHGELVAE
jgi:hypothetical protein